MMKQSIIKKTLTNSITPTFYENEYVKENTLAPGIKGYFDINIDSSKVDVDFNYEVNAVLNNSTNLTNFKITDYELNDSATKQNFSTTGISNSLPKKNKRQIKICRFGRHQSKFLLHR